MARGTQQPAEMAEVPTFVVLRETIVPIGMDTYRLHLYQEKVEAGREVQYYMLVNGHRIKPCEATALYDEDKAREWFDGVFTLFHQARIRACGPFD